MTYLLTMPIYIKLSLTWDIHFLESGDTWSVKLRKTQKIFRPSLNKFSGNSLESIHNPFSSLCSKKWSPSRFLSKCHPFYVGNKQLIRLRTQVWWRMLSIRNVTCSILKWNSTEKFYKFEDRRKHAKKYRCRWDSNPHLLAFAAGVLTI